MDVGIFSDELGNGNEAGRDMNVDPTELLGSVTDTPEQQQLDGLESEQLNDANSNDVARRRQRPRASQEAQGRFALQ